MKRINDALQRFAYIASHDLREPILTVATYNKLRRRKYGSQIPVEGAEFITFSIDACRRMHNLVADLTAYVEAVDTNIDPAFTRVPATDLVEQAIQSLQSAITEAGAAITYDPLPVIRGGRGATYTSVPEPDRQCDQVS